MNLKNKILVKLLVLAWLSPVAIVFFFAGNIFAALQQNYGIVKVIPSDTYYEKYGKYDGCQQPQRYEF